MTALAEQLAALGIYNSVALADVCITSGEVYRDSNSQIRCSGHDVAIMADYKTGSATQVAALTLYQGGNRPERGKTANHIH